MVIAVPLLASAQKSSEDLEYELWEQFLPGVEEPDFGERYLAAYGKGGSMLGAESRRRYGLATDVKLNGSHFGQWFRTKYFDATFNFCLTYDDHLVASIGFEVDERAMVIWQIQGVKGSGECLRPIKWERALVDYAVAWARDHAFAEVQVVSIEHHQWAATHGHLDVGRGKLRYDVTARRCGFRRSLDGYYSLTLGRAERHVRGIATS